ncbi:hypothetical protein [Celeribacter persicus]|uniref:Uncharacterized protein n=1 Tax=Celeribacter persicus TaxID=1651082 RepID=A0A2T5H3T6_9RHOB|nr:hypothetical protein [Celeribacter persicus]PTQ66236.1 hypothetical protein C8N42_13311 [Celeribacter persicus]
MFFNQIDRALYARTQNLCSIALLFLILTLCFAFWATTAEAARPKSQQPGATIIINGDPGGSVRTRYNEIKDINRLGQRVEIRRGACMSSCTMFLGADNVCVSPQTTFGFHGPYRFGEKLSQSEFDQWSQVIASHYPTPVRQWYMTKARYKIYSATHLSGAELIRLGIPICP